MCQPFVFLSLLLAQLMHEVLCKERMVHVSRGTTSYLQTDRRRFKLLCKPPQPAFPTLLSLGLATHAQLRVLRKRVQDQRSVPEYEKDCSMPACLCHRGIAWSL